MKKTHLLLLVFTLFISFGATAQKLPCTVITAGLDTLTGIFVKADDQLILRQGYDKRRVVLHPEDLYEYRLLQSDGTSVPYQFIKHPVTGKRKPMRRLVDGYYKLYLDKVPVRSSVNPGLPKNSSVPHYTTVYYVASYSEDAVEVSPHNWKAILQERLADCTILVENISRDNYKFKQLPAVVASYNAFVRQEVANERKLDAPLLEK